VKPPIRVLGLALRIRNHREIVVGLTQVQAPVHARPAALRWNVQVMEEGITNLSVKFNDRLSAGQNPARRHPHITFTDSLMASSDGQCVAGRRAVCTALQQLPRDE